MRYITLVGVLILVGCTTNAGYTLVRKADGECNIQALSERDVQGIEADIDGVNCTVTVKADTRERAWATALELSLEALRRQ